MRDLLGRADLASAGAGSAPMPDRYVYEFQLDDAEPVRVAEHELTDDLAALARAVLDPGGDGSRGV